MDDETLKFELTPEQTQQYNNWLRHVASLYAQEQENLDEVTISFTFTPFGQCIVAHTDSCIPKDGHQIVLQDL